MFVMLRKSILSSLIITIFLAIFLVGCANSTLPIETSVLNTPIAIETSVTPPFTETVPLPIETLVLTPTEVAYFDLSPDERLEISQALVAKADNFSGEVFVPVELNGQTYNFFWNPKVNDERYEADFPGAWKLEGSSNDLDTTGETLPRMVIPGYENPDGSLVVVDPVTGQETVYANQNIPALGGVISYRDLYNLPQNQLADIVTQALIDNPNYNNPDQTQQIFIDLKSQSLYLPVILYGGQTSVYTNSGTIGGGQYKNYDVPEANFVAFQTPTNNALMPVYSPETGDFMFFVNIMTGTPRSQFDVFYKADGTVNVGLVSVQDREAFGSNGLDQFGIITQSRFPKVAHNLGGDNTFMENSPMVGDVNVIEQILNASSEEEILDILDIHRLLVAYPSIIYRPAR